MKIQKKNLGGGGRVRGVGLGCQGRLERRIEAFVKIPKKKIFFFWGGGGRGGGGGVGFRGQGGCERRSKVFVKIEKKMRGGGGVGFGVRVDVNGEVKFL